MLKYMILVVETLLVPTILFGLMAVYHHDRETGKLKGQYRWAFLLMALFSFGVFVIKAVTVLINKAFYSIFILSFELPLAIGVMLCLIIAFKKQGLLTSKFYEWLTLIYLFFMGSYFFPTFFLFIEEFPMGEVSIASTPVLFKVLGYALSMIFLIVLGIGLYKVALKCQPSKVNRTIFVLVLINFVSHVFELIQPLLARRIIPFNKMLFNVMIFTINNHYIFIYASLVIALMIPISVWFKSFSMSERYDNPAEHRKLKAEARRRRRWASWIVFVFVYSVVNLTVVKAYNEREILLSPIEESLSDETHIYIPVEYVEDGILHRYAHTTSSGVEIRFIIIKKSPTAYGVGLDACEICGATGYYQRNDEVVCKRCDVVMNIQTIGFKGGCNPIPFDYKVDNGRIEIEKAVLEAYEKEFK